MVILTPTTSTRVDEIKPEWGHGTWASLRHSMHDRLKESCAHAAANHYCLFTRARFLASRDIKRCFLRCAVLIVSAFSGDDFLYLPGH